MFFVLFFVVRMVSINVSESIFFMNVVKILEEYILVFFYYYLEVFKRIFVSVGGFLGICVVYFFYFRVIII